VDIEMANRLATVSSPQNAECPVWRGIPVVLEVVIEMAD